MSETKPSPFGTIKAISETRPLTYQDLEEKDLPYEPFLVNRAFSLTQDTVLLAALMNERSFLDKDVQATFYIHTVRPRKRWEKWPKGIEDKEVRTVAQYYGMSMNEAKSTVGLHSPEQLEAMQKVLDSGATPKRGIA